MNSKKRLAFLAWLVVLFVINWGWALHNYGGTLSDDVLAQLLLEELFTWLSLAFIWLKVTFVMLCAVLAATLTVKRPSK